MFGSEVLDVAVGMVFVYATLSLICSAVQELIASWLKLRAQSLHQGILRLLDDVAGSGLARDFYAHPLINPLFPGDYVPGRSHNLPSYISSRDFALALMDLAAPRATAGELSGAGGATMGFQQTTQRLRDALARRAATLPPNVNQALTTLVDAAGNDIDNARENIERWYDNAMERVSSGYKRKTQFILLIIGVVVTGAVNADSISILTALSTNRALRDSLVAASTQAVKPESQAAVTAVSPIPGSDGPKGATGTTGTPNNPPATTAATTALDSRREAFLRELYRIPACTSGGDSSPDCRLELNLNRIRNSGLPIGWVSAATFGDPRSVPVRPADWFQKILGILLTVAATSLGAPFWFDLLGKVAAVRSAVKPGQGASTPAPAAKAS